MSSRPTTPIHPQRWAAWLVLYVVAGAFLVVLAALLAVAVLAL